MTPRLLALLLTVSTACATASRTDNQPADSDLPRSDASCPRPDIFGPVFLPADRYRERNGAAATTFAALSTSRSRPLEECGVRATLEKLALLRCNDGSNPFNLDLKTTHASRRGAVGSGGRCGSMIDAYEIACPERRYEVFADSYVCPQK